MRLPCLVFCILALIGCGGGLRGEVVGNWHVDPASIETPRLVEGAKSTKDWADATALMAKVQLRLTDKGEATVKGFDLTSTGSWTLRGFTVKIEGKGEDWPVMTYDPNTKRIHASMTKGEDQLKMDLVKD